MSDYIKLTWDGTAVYINAYRVNAVVVDEDGDTLIVMNAPGQTLVASESAEEVVAMLDAVVNGTVPVKGNVKMFPGMEG